MYLVITLWITLSIHNPFFKLTCVGGTENKSNSVLAHSPNLLCTKFIFNRICLGDVLAHLVGLHLVADAFLFLALHLVLDSFLFLAERLLLLRPCPV